MEEKLRAAIRHRPVGIGFAARDSPLQYPEAPDVPGNGKFRRNAEVADHGNKIRNCLLNVCAWSPRGLKKNVSKFSMIFTALLVVLMPLAVSITTLALVS